MYLDKRFHNVTGGSWEKVDRVKIVITVIVRTLLPHPFCVRPICDKVIVEDKSKRENLVTRQSSLVLLPTKRGFNLNHEDKKRNRGTDVKRECRSLCVGT